VCSHLELPQVERSHEQLVVGAGGDSPKAGHLLSKQLRLPQRISLV
jgi:hypothetical protein